VEKEINFISSFEKKLKIKILHQERYFNAILKKETKGFTINLSNVNDRDIDQHKPIILAIKDQNFETRDYYKKIRSFSSSKGPGMQLFVNSFAEVKSGKKSYCRCIIPLSKNISFNNILSYATDKDRANGVQKIKIKDTEVLKVLIEEKRYLVIESTIKTSHSDFEEQCWSIIIGLGYVTGFFAQNEKFNFYYDKKDLITATKVSYKTQRDSINSFYHPVNANPFGWSLPNSLKDKYYGKLREISNVQFSQLCSLIHYDVDIKAMILLLIEAVSRSLLLMPAGLSVVLEGLSEYFFRLGGEKLKPISQKALSKQIISEMEKVLSNYRETEGIANYTVLEQKIKMLNSPTNREKLKFPFTYLGINLSPLDEEVIEFRNDFLHGNINLHPKKGKKIEMDSFEISLRLLTLINTVFMKMIGFEGYILNHTRLQQAGLRKKIKELPFIKI